MLGAEPDDKALRHLANTEHALGRLDGREFLRVHVDRADERYRPVLHVHTDMNRLELRIPPELVIDVLPQLLICLLHESS